MKRKIDWLSIGVTFLLIVWGFWHFTQKPYGDFSLYVGIAQIFLGGLVIYFRFIKKRRKR